MKKGQKFELPELGNKGTGSAGSKLEEIKDRPLEDNKQDYYIDYDLLDTSEFNEFPTDDKEKIEEIKESLRNYGLIHNLLVIQKPDGRYKILSGETRYWAIGELLNEGNKRFLNGVRCHAIDPNTPEVDQKILVEEANIRQREYTPGLLRSSIDRLSSLYKERSKQKKEKINVTKQISEKTGLGERQVQKYNSINQKLIPELQELFDEGNININKADTYSRLPEEAQELIISLIKENNNAKIEALIAQTKDAEKNIKKTEIDLQAKEKENETLLADLNAKNEEIKKAAEIERDLHEKLKNANDTEEVKKLQAEIQRARSETQKQEEQKNNLNEIVSTSQKTISELKKEIENLKNSATLPKEIEEKQIQKIELQNLQSDICDKLKIFSLKAKKYNSQYDESINLTEILKEYTGV